HIDVYGHRAFVSASSGRGTLAVACFPRKSHSCALQATVSAGGQTLAQAPRQHFISGRGGLLRFSLSSAGRRQLNQSGAKGLPVEVRLRSPAGELATVHLNLVPFSTSGPWPKRTVSESPTIQIVGTTDFASRTGQGSILAACYAPAPCRVRVAIS